MWSKMGALNNVPEHVDEVFVAEPIFSIKYWNATQILEWAHKSGYRGFSKKEV